MLDKTEKKKPQNVFECQPSLAQWERLEKRLSIASTQHIFNFSHKWMNRVSWVEREADEQNRLRRKN